MPEKTLVFIESNFQMMNTETQTKLISWKDGNRNRSKRSKFNTIHRELVHCLRSQEYSNLSLKETRLPNKVV